MSSDSTPAPQSQRLAVRLNRWPRYGAAALGMAGMGSGGVAVFTTHLEAGPVALIASGVIFLLVALGGVMPTRLKVGDNEAEWINEVQEAAAAVAVSAAGNNQDQLTASLDRLRHLSPAMASSIAALIHTARSYGLIEQTIEGRGDVTLSTVVHDGAVHIMLEASNGNKALVQPMANDIITMLNATRILDQSVEDAKLLGASRVFLVLDQLPSGKLIAAIDKDLNIMPVIVKRGSWPLIREVEALLDLEPD